jgi:hypothetical protein
MSSTRRHDNSNNDDEHEVELSMNKSKPPQQRDTSRRTTSKVSSSSRENSRNSGPIDLDARENSRNSGPIDLDELFGDYTMSTDSDDESLFDATKHEDSRGILEESFRRSEARRYFSNPVRRRMDTDTSMIPGSPFSKPPNMPSTRPKEPLSLAKYASTLAFLLTFSLIGILFFFAFWNYSSVSRVM